MWRICYTNIVHTCTFHLRRASKTCFQSEMEKLLCHDRAKIQQYQSFFTSSGTIRPQHIKDKVPRDFAVIYEHRIWKILLPARVLSTVSCLATAVISLGTVLKSFGALEPWDLYFHIGICVFSLIMTVFLNVMFRYYLLRIYFNKDNNKFIGVFRSFLGNVKHVQYSLTDLQTMKRPVMHAGHEKCNIHIGGKRYHLRGTDFILPKYFNMHLGL